MSGPGTHYTTGTEDYTGQAFCAPFTGAVCEATGMGAPSEAPHLETVNGTPSLCIDPPTFVDFTFHSDVREALTFNYAPDAANLFHGVQHACIPWTLPECGKSETVTASWNIGQGTTSVTLNGPECPVPVVHTCEQEETCPVAPVAPIPAAPVAEVPVVPAITTTAVEVPAKPVERLPHTGAGETMGLATVGLMLAVVGARLARRFGTRGGRGIAEATR